MFLSKRTVRSRALIIPLKAGQRTFCGGQFIRTGARSFLSHLVSDPHAQNTFRAWLSAWLRIPWLADGAFESLKPSYRYRAAYYLRGGCAGSEAELA